jgi:Tfp pilus assembly pilus retraction ATPase PilT
VYSVLETSTKEGMTTMDRSIKDLYMQGLISHDDAVAHVRNPKILSSR